MQYSEPTTRSIQASGARALLLNQKPKRGTVPKTSRDEWRCLCPAQCKITTGLDVQLLEQLVPLANTQIHSVIESVSNVLHYRAFEEGRKQLHKLKGSIANFCQKKLLDHCSDIELLLSTESVYASLHWEELATELLILASELDDFHRILKNNKQGAK